MVERCPDKTEVDGPIPSTLTMENKNNSIWQPVLTFYAKVTSWVILPLIFALIFEKYLNKEANSQILFFIVLTSAFLVTCFGIYKEIKKYKLDIEREENYKKDLNENGNK